MTTRERADLCAATDTYGTTTLVCARRRGHYSRHITTDGWRWGDPGPATPRVDLAAWAATPTSLEGTPRV